MDINKVLKEHIEEHINKSLKKSEKKQAEKLEEKVFKRLSKQLQAFRPIELKKDSDTFKVPSGLRHAKTELVLTYLSQGIPLLLVGEAGSGKTHIAMDCSKILNLNCYSISVNDQTSKADFLGYTDAKGFVVKTNFRKAYETGGVFVIDEIDAGNPNVLTVINSALSNDLCPFPDGMVKKHSNFNIVCTANTFGEGESVQYIGRNILDSATKDRFACIYIEYSREIEDVLVPNFSELIRNLRKHFKNQGENVVISTRAGIRLEALKKAKNKLSFDDMTDCLNLHQIIERDSRVVDILKSIKN